jgi:hypothetical protein
MGRLLKEFADGFISLRANSFPLRFLGGFIPFLLFHLFDKLREFRDKAVHAEVVRMSVSASCALFGYLSQSANFSLAASSCDINDCFA